MEVVFVGHCSSFLEAVRVLRPVGSRCAFRPFFLFCFPRRCSGDAFCMSPRWGVFRDFVRLCTVFALALSLVAFESCVLMSFDLFLVVRFAVTRESLSRDGVRREYYSTPLSGFSGIGQGLRLFLVIWGAFRSCMVSCMSP